MTFTSQQAANVLLVAHQFARTKAKPPTQDYLSAFDASMRDQLGEADYEAKLSAVAEAMGEKWPDASWYGG